MKRRLILWALGVLVVVSGTAALAGPPAAGLHIWLDGQDPDGDGFLWNRPHNGDVVPVWFDKATADGSRNAVQGGRLPPVYATDQTNGMGALDFTQPGTNLLQFTPVMVGGQERTYFVVAKGKAAVNHRRTNATGGNYMLFDYPADRLFGGYSDLGNSKTSPGIDPNVYHLASYLMRTDGVYVFSSGAAHWSSSESHLNAPISAHVLGAVNVNSDFDPLIAEVILYTNAVPYITQLLTENYLAAKYGYALPPAKEVYQGDAPGNGDYDLQVIGIGRESNVTVNAASEGGLSLAESGGSLDANGEFVLAGHKAAINDRTSSGVPAGSLTRRWNRVWYVDATGTVNVVMTFDFSDAGLPAPAGGTSFALLRSASESPYAFTDMGLSETVNGDAISFTVNGVTDGYYTLASDEALPAVTSPADQGGLPAANLHIWFNASDVDGDRQSTNNPAHGSSVTTWYDAAVADGQQNALKHGSAAPPVYGSSVINGMGVVDFPSTNDALYFTPAYTYGAKTFFLVMKGRGAINHRNTNAAGGNYASTPRAGDALFSGWSDAGVLVSAPTVNTTVFRLATVDLRTDGTYVYDNGIFFWSSVQTFLNSITSHVLGNAYNIGAVTQDADPTIAEIIMYSNTVSEVQRLLVENYLSAKYDLAIAGRDRYAGDEAAQGDYDLDVFGIGGGAGEDVTGNARQGLVLGAPWLADGQFVLAGHRTVTNGIVDSTAEGVSGERWARAWYVDASGAPGDVQLGFDLSEGGIGGSADYWTDLYYSASTPFDWTRLGLTPTVNGDRAVFTLSTAALQDGYYTAGRFIPRGTVITVR